MGRSRRWSTAMKPRRWNCQYRLSSGFIVGWTAKAFRLRTRVRSTNRTHRHFGVAVNLIRTWISSAGAAGTLDTGAATVLCSDRSCLSIIGIGCCESRPRRYELGTRRRSAGIAGRIAKAAAGDRHCVVAADYLRRRWSYPCTGSIRPESITNTCRGRRCYRTESRRNVVLANYSSSCTEGTLATIIGATLSLLKDMGLLLDCRLIAGPISGVASGLWGSRFWKQGCIEDRRSSLFDRPPFPQRGHGSSSLPPISNCRKLRKRQRQISLSFPISQFVLTLKAGSKCGSRQSLDHC